MVGWWVVVGGPEGRVLGTWGGGMEGRWGMKGKMKEFIATVRKLDRMSAREILRARELLREVTQVGLIKRHEVREWYEFCYQAGRITARQRDCLIQASEYFHSRVNVAQARGDLSSITFLGVGVLRKSAEHLGTKNKILIVDFGLNEAGTNVVQNICQDTTVVEAEILKRCLETVLKNFSKLEREERVKRLSKSSRKKASR